MLTTLLFLLPINVNALSSHKFTQNISCAVVFDGISCTHCAIADPVLFKNYVRNHNILIIEYEVYENKENAPLIYESHRRYGSPLGIPLMLFSEENSTKFLVGDNEIVNFLKSNRTLISSKCLLPEGTVNIEKNIEKLDSTIQGQPRIWFRDRVLILKNTKNISLYLKILLSENIENSILNSGMPAESINKEVTIAGGSIEFKNAVKINNNILEWNSNELNSSLKLNSLTNTVSKKKSEKEESEKKGITWLGVISLAAVDAINPCALAVLVMMLIAILAYNPRKKEKVLLAGILFSLAVFIMYFAYGILIIKFFKIIQEISSIRFWVYKSVAVLALILSALEIKDFVSYKPGTPGTEMPLSLRPKVKKIINSITSPAGAFSIGLFVTLFLLPCTIGPYVIFGSIVSTMQYIKVLPFITVYNIVFILPMIGITLAVYLGLSKVKDVKSWRDKNIRAIHLIAGIIIGLLGLGMLVGLF